MLFTSLDFVVLLLSTLFIYYLPVARRFQILVLIVASFTFYAFATPWLLSILVLSCSINAVSSFYVLKSDRLATQRWWASVGVVVNLGLLLFFKYSGLLFRSFGGDIGHTNDLGRFVLTIPLPIGISFFTFQGISLVIDVFRSRRSNDTGFIRSRNFAEHLYHTVFFKSFFPQLIAGPIVKARQFFPQIAPKSFSGVQWDAAFRYLVTGYFLKMVVADNLKDQTFWIAAPHFLVFSGVELIVLLFGYSMQIFADFAGYSLIALGLAALFGYALPINFNFPYISRSFSEFWTRWHISLSTWLREYLYIPLGGNRHGELRTYFNLFLVMFLGGLWHGAAWSYAIWGSVHGLALAVERFAQRGRATGVRHWSTSVLQASVVFAFVTIAWLFFKLPDLRDVFGYVGAVVDNARMKPDKVVLLLVAIYSFPVVVYHALYLYRSRRRDMPAFRSSWASAAYAAMLFMIATNSGSSGDFIYFQF